MNRPGKAVIAFFGVAGVVMVLVAREFTERGGELGNVARTFNLIGIIWTAVAIFLVVVVLLAGRASRAAARQVELQRDAPEGPDVTS